MISRTRTLTPIRSAAIGFIAAATLGLSACSAATREAGYVTRSVTDIQQTVTDKNHPAVIDVREPDEFASGHVPGAVNVPLATVGTWAATQPKDAPCVVICQSGRRSVAASEVLVKQGFKEVINVAGGTAAWIEQGLPVSK
jgi:rhodanese-related sulfurtransferase